MGRPFHEQARFDYNVSHHSGRVAIGVRVADSRHIGIDVVDPEDATRNWKPGWIDDFHDIFTESEYAQILRDGKKEIEITKRRLFTFWALKEAYTKAVGIGLVADLRTIEFSRVEDVDITERPYTRSTICKVNNEVIDWRFEVFALEDDLILATATTNEGLFGAGTTKIKKIELDYITKVAVQYHLPITLAPQYNS
jgi:phosphopantetheinyl transferase